MAVCYVTALSQAGLMDPPWQCTADCVLDLSLLPGGCHSLACVPAAAPLFCIVYSLASQISLAQTHWMPEACTNGHKKWCRTLLIDISLVLFIGRIASDHIWCNCFFLASELHKVSSCFFENGAAFRCWRCQVLSSWNLNSDLDFSLLVHRSLQT